MARLRRIGRRCSFESLEDRRLLAGDVIAKIVNGNLVVKGDNLDNGIAITAGANAGDVVVTGVNAGGSATNVNGTANGVVTLTGFSGDLNIKMKRGNDSVAITWITTSGKAKVKGGHGDDTFDISDADFNGKLIVKLGEGDDSLSLRSTTVVGKAKVSGHSGSDDATVTDSMFSELGVSLGKGDDLLTVARTTTSAKTSFNGRRGTNTYTDGGGNSLADLSIRHFDETSSTTPSNDVALNPVANISEGGTAILTGTYTDRDTSSSHTLTVDWGDPNADIDSTFAIPNAASLTTGQTIASSTDSAVLTVTSVNAGQIGYSVQHRYQDDGVAPGNFTNSDTSTITVTVTNGGAFNDGDTTTVTVSNSAPSVTLDPVSDVLENGVATLTGRYTDPGLLDAETLAVTWGDPDNSAASTFAISAVQNADGTSNLAVGQVFNSSTDGATLTITSIDNTGGQIGFAVQHRYLDDGAAIGNSTPSDTSTISVAVTDDDGLSGASSTNVKVNNVAPAILLNAVPDITVNGTVTLTGTYSDSGLLDQHPLLVEWGDSTASQFLISAIRDTAGAGTLNVGQTFNSSSDSAILTITSIDANAGQVGFSVGHQYTAAGTDLSISATLLDDDTGNGTASTTVTVGVLAPIVALNPVPAINESETATLTGSFTNIVVADTHTLTVNWGDSNNGNTSTFAVPATNGLSVNQTINSTTDSAVLTITSVNTTTGQVGVSVQHQYVDDGNSSTGNFTTSDESTIVFFVTGATAGSGFNITTVTVNNMAPTVAVDPVSDINENDTVTLTGTYTDIGLADAHLVAVNWSDPNGIPSEFQVNPTAVLLVGDMVNSLTDSAILTITSINISTGEVGFSVQHRYADDGSSPGNATTSDSTTITVVVEDDDASNGSANATFVVKNIAPVVALDPVSDINENATATLMGVYTDTGLLDEHTLTIDWDDPSSSDNATFAISGTSSLKMNDTFNSTTDGSVLTITSINISTGEVGFSVQHEYTAASSPTVIATVADDDLGSGSEMVSFAVGNV